jgi:hypothetical protein
MARPQIAFPWPVGEQEGLMTLAPAARDVRTRPAARSDLRISEVFSASWRYFAKRWLAYLGVGLVAYLISSTIQRALFAWLAGRGDALPPVELPEVALGVIATVLAVIALIALPGLVSVIVSAIIYVGLSRDAKAEYFSIAKSMTGALGRLPALMAAGVILSLVIVPLFLLFIVPGVIAACVYAVVLQACLVENLGPIESMERSYRLTKGYRWQIFVLTSASAAILLAAICATVAMGSILDGVAGGPTLLLIVNCLAESFSTSFFIITGYVLYFQLRYLKEGPEIESSAAKAVRRTSAPSFFMSEEA